MGGSSPGDLLVYSYEGEYFDFAHPEILNVLVASWHAWWYGGPFGARAFVESLPIFALALCFDGTTGADILGAFRSVRG